MAKRKRKANQPKQPPRRFPREFTPRPGYVPPVQLATASQRTEIRRLLAEIDDPKITDQIEADLKTMTSALAPMFIDDLLARAGHRAPGR